MITIATRKYGKCNNFQEYQQAAGKVSEYAQTSIGEFIAETYAKMVRGDKITDDVMKLYEKYNGPKLGV